MATSLLGMTKIARRNVDENVVTLSAGPCTLKGVQVLNAQGVTAFIQFFDTVGNVTPGTTLPDYEICVAANSNHEPYISARGIDFINGLKMISTTAEAGNIGSADGVHVFVQLE